jgi:hypothetical protein
MSGPPDDERDSPSNPPRTTALPSFTPIQDDSGTSIKAESSASESRRSANDSAYTPDSKTRNRTSYGGVFSGKSPEQTNGTTRRRKSQRSSGGFLLDQAFSASGFSRRLLSHSQDDQRDVKGKRKSDGSELVMPKRRVGETRQAYTIGSSPLTAEVKPSMVSEESLTNGSLTAAADAQPSEISQSSSHGLDSTENGWTDSLQSVRPSIGYNTDPTQIVHMALSLSEGRRMQASRMRPVSGQVGGRRAASGFVSNPSSITANTGSIGQFLTPQRQASRNISPRPSAVSPKSNGSTSKSSPGFLVALNGFEEDELEQDHLFSLSPATVKRVQKAKNYFELAYEHRRLLSHLPPIRTPGGRPNSQSKVYNPLQYVRNRKLRFREKSPIAAEAEGWHDIWQVRMWVDAVISTHTDTRHDPDECVRLPDLAYNKPLAVKDGEDLLELESADFGRQPSGNQTIKPKRPRSDWETHPGDFIADAFWLEQGLNKTKIEDGNGNPIYPPNTHFKFSGWRNRAPIDVPIDLQEHLPPSEPAAEVPIKDPRHPSMPDLPNFRSAHPDKRFHKDSRRDKIRDSFAAIPKDSRHHSTGISRNVDYSSGSRTVSDTEDETELRGRKRTSRKLQKKLSGRDSSSFKRRVADEAPSTGNYNQSQSGPGSKRESLDNSRISKLFTRDSTKSYNILHPSHSRSGSTRHNSGTPRISLESDRLPRNSAEYDTTAPDSPPAPEFPSIAINLSPPHSRSPSPSKKLFSSRLNPFQDRSKHGISTNDFALDIPSRGRSHEIDPGEESLDPLSRGTSPTRVVDPGTRKDSVEEAHISTIDQHRSTVSRTGTKSSIPSVEGQTKIRGIFKGGRIAELVGNEVSRVGDFIWKRDAPATYRPRMSASTTSINSHHYSDTDEENWQNGNVLKTPSPGHRGRFQSNGSSPGDHHSPTLSKSTPSSADRTQYYNPNLPVFTSPFQRDKESQDERKVISSKTSTDDRDHISRLAAQHRSNSKSPRLDRLAPPKLDTNHPVTTPSIMVTSDRRNSYGFGSGLDLSNSRNASQIFNDVIDNKPEDIPSTGLTDLMASRSGGSLALSWNTSNQSLVKSNVTREDIARVAALLMSSAVKAREIKIRADTPRNQVPKFLLDTINSSHTLPPKVNRREEHVVAARNLITTLRTEANQFQTNLRVFSTITTPYLHTELQTLEDMVDNKMTPSVRVAADQAGELSMKLSTTSTLEVKALNDIISTALRRRRRGPLRELRRLGYKIIEVGVVGILWGIWLIVTLFHIVMTIINGIWSVLRWLFWLD